MNNISKFISSSVHQFIRILPFKLVKVIVFSLFIFSACKKDELIQSQNSDKINNSRIGVENSYSDNELVLGKKLEIPYKISIVEKSQNALKAKNKDFKPIKVTENYYYVRVLPKNEEENDLLNSDSTINTFDHPMDYEIIKQGNKYKDPQLKDSKYSYIYCVIPVDKKFKGLKTEILERLYIPFGSGANDNFSKKLAKLDDKNLKALDEEVLTSTGYLSKKKNAKTAAWFPSGRIRVHENSGSTNFVPVEGCKVRSTKALVVTHSTLSENDGTFRINESYWDISQVNYDIKWERADFDIRSGSYGQAYFNGPHQRGDWNCDITSNGTHLSYLYAWVHKAANAYYYNHTNYGIVPPPGVNHVGWNYGPIARLLLTHRLHLGVSEFVSYNWPFKWYEELKNRGHYFDFNDNWLAAEIRLPFRIGADRENVFGTTIHELAHASHWSFGYNTADYSLNANDNRKLAESWAQAVGWFVTARYFGFQPQNVGNDIITDESIQDQSLAILQDNEEYYTPAFIDLIDNFNQGDPNDQANNYTLTELEATLVNCPKNWEAYRNKLAERTTNPTEEQMLWIFNNYR